VISPGTPQELAVALRAAASRSESIALSGHSSKRLMAGPIGGADHQISTCGLRRVLQYEPRDLTISVESGLPWRELERVLAPNRQMVPLDPPFGGEATVGGVMASNSNGPRRRLYGTARDLVIGMQFATLEGKLVQSGGMVVKNVAGLDMAKLMIGSFGTLAAITVVNFKLLSQPAIDRSFLLPFQSAAAAVAGRNLILAGALQPAAVDLLNPAAGVMLGNSAWLLAVRAGGNAAVIARFERELAAISEGANAFEDKVQQELWRRIEDFTPAFLSRHLDGAVVRASCTLKELEAVMATFEGPAIARAGSGVAYGYFEQTDKAAAWLREATGRGWKAVIEFAPAGRRANLELWPSPGGDLEIMQRIKRLFDPNQLLNRDRLYHRI